MSDSEDSTVTYTAVSSPFADLPDIGSPGVDGPPVMPEDPYAYVSLCHPRMRHVPASGPEETGEEMRRSLRRPVDYPSDVNRMLIIEGDEEEEEHPAPADSIVVVLPAVDHAPSAKDTESFKTDESAATPPPHPAYRVTARISIRDEPPTPFWSDTKVSRLLAIPTPPPSPLSPWSSPLPQIPSPPLPLRRPLRAEAASTSHSLPLPPPIILSHTRSDAPSSRTPLLPISLPTSSLPLHLLSTDRRADRPEGDYAGSRERCRLWRSPTLGMRCWQDTNKIYTRLDDEQSKRQLMAGRLNMLYRDRRAHAHTARLMEAEARMSREAWG
ncbi:hypothetical protein Tco_0087693 [Tanacetum coccineum]